MYPPSWLPAACLVAVLAASTFRRFQLRSAGVRAYGFDHNRSIQSVAEHFWRMAVVLAAAAAVITWALPDLEVHLGRPAWSFNPSLLWIAASVMVCATALILMAQASMGASWRVGVPSEGPGALVTGGLFAISRNPVFVGMFSFLVGLFLWSPNLLTAALLPLAAATIAMQVRIEEEALSAKHGDRYAAYVARTPRWLRPLG